MHAANAGKARRKIRPKIFAFLLFPRKNQKVHKKVNKSQAHPKDKRAFFMYN